MAEIRWTDEALHWLHEIFNFIASQNPDAAQNVIEGIYNKAQLLADFPDLGHKYRDETDGEIRILLYGHYRIAYLIRTDAIDILGVFHGALDLAHYFPPGE